MSAEPPKDAITLPEPEPLLPPAPSVAPAPVKGRSLWDDARRRLSHNRAAMVSLGVLCALGLLAIFGPWLWVHPVDLIFRDKISAAPTAVDMHWFGTDAQGRDMVARVLFGLRISLMVGIVATAVSLAIGVLWGAVAGYSGGIVDSVMMRIVDVMYTVPFIFFVIVLMVTFGSNIFLIFVAIGAVEWLTMARIVRGLAMSLKHKEFIEAARASGASDWQIITRHIAPNVVGPVIIYATLNVPVVILAESFLSFLGLGVQEPLTSLGQLIAVGAKEMDVAPWLLTIPAAAMFVTLLCLNFLGDGLRDALDPKER